MTAVFFGKLVYFVFFIFGQLQTLTLCKLIEGRFSNVANFVPEIAR